VAMSMVGLTEVAFGPALLQPNGAAVKALGRIDPAGKPTWGGVLHCAEPGGAVSHLAPRASGGVVYVGSYSGLVAIDSPPDLVGVTDVLALGLKP